MTQFPQSISRKPTSLAKVLSERPIPAPSDVQLECLNRLRINQTRRIRALRKRISQYAHNRRVTSTHLLERRMVLLLNQIHRLQAEDRYRRHEESQIWREVR
ncbi:hypothetical protein N7517_004717 [Penicillium concentricum]|uniref:Uncharacterized protein n=1 Tax=Penicillium concentricum TaxID=293559 RepID=A0A9W9S605_9EURO|nr:uncharacterized protein N7517_004717 [Penicillium concentricum]KAJ5372711.1 hypothetical protein N7517_004717 [Penicillium concentricum]